MALDGIYLYHLKNEIATFSVGARIEKIHQPSKEELVFSLRSREGAKKLLISAKADSAGVYFTNYPPENPKRPAMLCMLLRKHLNGAKITGITQDGLERILTINLTNTNEIGDSVQFSLIVEIMGRYSNAILLNSEGIIIDSLKRVGAEKSQVRQILPGESYTPPPPQKKLNIFTDDEDVILRRIKESDRSPARAFQDTVMGVSPIVCREYENGVSLHSIKLGAMNPTPTVIINEKPIDFCFMPVYQYGTFVKEKQFSTFSECLDYFYHEKVRLLRIQQRSAELFKTLQTLKERAVRKAITRQKELEACRDKETLKIYGDLISANQYSLKKGSSLYTVQNFYNDNAPVEIPADPALTPNENAQKYYKEYRKKQVAETKLVAFIEDAKAEAAYLDTVIDSLTRAETDGEISAIKLELVKTGYLKQKSFKTSAEKAQKPMLFESSEGFKIFVGKNNTMNDRLTLKTANGSDLWFHTKAVAGSHVVVQHDGREFTDKVIREAAMLAVCHSRANGSTNVAVDYTAVKNVKKPAGAKPGMVIYDNYKTEYVTPNDEELGRITLLAK